MRWLSRVLLTLCLTCGASAETPAAAPSEGPPGSSGDRIETLTEKAREEIRGERHEDALQTMQKLLDLAQELGETELAMNVSVQMAMSSSTLGDRAAAIEHYRRAAKLARQVGNLQGVAATMNAVGFEASLLGRHQEAAAAYEEGLRVAREIQDSANEDAARQGLALLQKMQAQESFNHESLLATYHETLEMAEEFASPDLMASSLEALATTYQSLGDWPAALRYAERLVPLVRERGDGAAEGRMLRLMATAHQWMSRLGQALELCGRSLELARQRSDAQGLQDSEHCLASTYMTLGDTDRAVRRARAYTDLARRNGDREAVAQGLHLEGAARLSAGEIDAARPLLVESARAYQKLGSLVEALVVEASLALVDLLGGRTKEALERYQDVAKRLANVKDPTFDPTVRRQLEAALNADLARLHATSGRPKDALALAQDALRGAEESGDDQGLAIAHESLGFVLLQDGKTPQATEHLAQAATAWDRAFGKAELSDLKSVALLDRTSPTYDLLQEVRVRQNQPLLALAAAERGRGLGRGRPWPETGKDAEEDFGRAVRELARKRRTTLVVYSVLHDPGGFLVSGRLEGRQRSLEQELLIWVVRPNGDAVVRRVDLAARRGAGKGSLADLVDRAVPATEQEEPARIAGCSPGTSMRGELGRGARPASRNLANPLAELAEVLISPIADLLPSAPGAPVVLVPHGPLLRVPFAALRVKDAYLIERSTLSTATSVTALLSAERSSSPEPAAAAEMLVVGDPELSTEEQCRGFEPLKGARREAETVAETVAGSSTTDLLIGREATRDEVLRRLQGARWVHLATHGDLLGGDREYPGALLLAAPKGSADGRLTARDIADLDLAADLVVLSACDTGRGRITAEGVVGLPRAFLTAGTSRVVVSLWQVPDETTRQLMVDFYGALREDPDPARALRGAMLGAIRREVEPRGWAAFVVVE